MTWMMASMTQVIADTKNVEPAASIAAVFDVVSGIIARFAIRSPGSPPDLEEAQPAASIRECLCPNRPFSQMGSVTHARNP
jgi:hypothetical protein